MRYILSGDDRALRHVLQENRYRVRLGVIKFTPMPDEAEDIKDVFVADCKDISVNVQDAKSIKRKPRKKQ